MVATRHATRLPGTRPVLNWMAKAEDLAVTAADDAEARSMAD
jgi:hypothetical protein